MAWPENVSEMAEMMEMMEINAFRGSGIQAKFIISDPPHGLIRAGTDMSGPGHPFSVFPKNSSFPIPRTA